MTIPLGQPPAQATENVYLRERLRRPAIWPRLPNGFRPIFSARPHGRARDQANGEQSIAPNTTDHEFADDRRRSAAGRHVPRRFVYADQPYDAMNPSTESTVSGNYSVTVELTTAKCNSPVSRPRLPSTDTITSAPTAFDADGSYYYVGEADLAIRRRRSPTTLIQPIFRRRTN